MKMADDMRYLVSGWEDDIENIDVARNPENVQERAILEAAENGDLERAQSLIETNPYLVSIKDRDGYTPLHRAAYGNHVYVAKYLLRNGADITAKTDTMWEPLHSCCHWNNKAVGSLLLQYGADVNALSEGKQTPLHIAAAHGANYDFVQLLLMHPYIKTDIINNNDDTALDIAKRSSKFYNVFDMVDPLLNISLLDKLK